LFHCIQFNSNFTESNFKGSNLNRLTKRQEHTFARCVRFLASLFSEKLAVFL